MNSTTFNKNHGHLQAISAFIFWGLVPLYWNFLHFIPAVLNTSLRVVITVVTFNLLFFSKRLWREIPTVLKQKKLFFTLIVSSLLITTNWVVFLVSFQEGMIWQSSLGYYLCPLCNVLLSVAILKEKLSLPLKFATGFIILAMGNMIWNLGALPWISLLLCLTFSFYALLKKNIKIHPMSGLYMEVHIILPFALWCTGVGLLEYQLSYQEWFFMLLSGIITIIPLVLYNASAQKIPFSHLALYQYISPTIQFLVAIFIFKENLAIFHYQSFFLIWCGLMIFTWERIMTLKHKKVTI
jgi:chloramphenicol-sensitive protein RarD